MQEPSAAVGEAGIGPRPHLHMGDPASPPPWLILGCTWRDKEHPGPSVRSGPAPPNADIWLDATPPRCPKPTALALLESGPRLPDPQPWGPPGRCRRPACVRHVGPLSRQERRELVSMPAAPALSPRSRSPNPCLCLPSTSTLSCPAVSPSPKFQKFHRSQAPC